MSKLEQLNAEIKNVSFDTVQNLLMKLVEAGDFQKALFYAAGCLTYCDDVEERKALTNIRDLLL